MLFDGQQTTDNKHFHITSTTNTFSIREKYKAPKTTRTIEVRRPGTIYCHCMGVPKIQDRKPSMTPTRGFREYKIRYFSGIDDAE
jgi:hypothetical protein